jgi:predicted DNA-binding transcriptional regulator AlpA
VMSKRETVEPVLVKLTTVAKLCSMDTETIRAWIKRGQFPQPLVNNERTMLYRKSDVDHFLAKGTWPDGMNWSKPPRLVRHSAPSES